MSHLVALVLGLGAGATLAMLAVGILLTFRASGVVNFAHAAVGMWVAHVFYEFRETGDILFPMPFREVFGVTLPEWVQRVHVLHRPTLASALAIVLTYAALLGLFEYVAIFKWLRHRPPLARVVASIGVFLYLYACVPLMFDVPPQTRAILPTGSVSLFGERVFTDRLVIALIAVLVTAFVWAVSRFTRFGLATTAAAESEKGALLTGLRPDRLAAVNWMLAATLAGLAMILVGRINSLDPLAMSLLVVPALAAALLGGFRSFVWVAVAGFGIGMLQGELVNLQSDLSALSTLGLEQGLPFVLILIALLVRGKSLPTRGEVIEARLPFSPEPRFAWLIGGVSIAAGAVVMLVGSADWRAAVITSGIAMLTSLSIVVLTGYIGQISLAPFAFAGVAAFSLVKLGDAGVPFPVAPLLAAVITTVLGVLVGIPAVRVRGMNLAIATLGAAVAIEQLLFKWQWFTGDADVPAPEIGGVDLSISGKGDLYRGAFGVMVVVTAAVAAVAVANLRRGSTGLSWLAVRANERAAAAAGVDVTAAKLTAFGVSAFLAAIGGTLIAYQRMTLTASSFQVMVSLAAIAITYLAGVASVGGAVTAGLIAPLGVLVLITNGGELPLDVSRYTFAINGLLLVVVAILLPEGVTGLFRRLTVRRRVPELV